MLELSRLDDDPIIDCLVLEEYCSNQLASTCRSHHNYYPNTAGVIGINGIPSSIVYCLCQSQSCELSLFFNSIRCVDFRIHIQAQVSSQNDAVLLHTIAICLYDVSSSPKRSVGGWLLCVVVANVALNQIFISSLNCTETILSSQLQDCTADQCITHLSTLY